MLPIRRLPYLPALDGLRAMAVLAVLLYHADLPWIPGGFLGVEIFFVISGYLITLLLLEEWSCCGRVDLKGFWLRRARRLFPALCALLLVVVAFAVVFLPAEVAGLRGDVMSSALYMNNWYQVFSHKSYFDTVGRPSLLRHLWSLAVEEQFYLLWPLLFGLLMRRSRPRLALFAVLAGALASMLWMATRYQPDADPSRPYYGTDTRAGGLLLGAALAFVWSPRRAVGRAGGWALEGAGLAAAGTLAACVLLVNESQAFLYCGGFALVGVMTAVLIAAAVHPRARLVARSLSWAPLRWVGLRSYGIYLWHFPVFMVTRPQLDVPMDGVSLLTVRFVLTGVLAALSYRWLETPIRQGALGRSWSALREARGQAAHVPRRRWAVASASLLTVSSILGIALLTARPPAPPAYLRATSASGMSEADPAGREAHSAPAPTGAAASVAQVSAVPAPAPTRFESPTSLTAPVVSPPAPADEPSGGTASLASVTAIGDSVLQGVAGELTRVLGGNVIVDADQGRLPWRTPAVVRALHAEGKINPVVILHIGDNGFFSARVFERIMAELQEARRVVVVNVKVPRNWENPNNAMLGSAVVRYPNAVLVDWHSASAGRPELFWKDGIHLRPAGARFYADLVAKAVKSPAHAGPCPADFPSGTGTPGAGHEQGLAAADR